MTLNRLKKRHLFILWELKRKHKIALFDFSWECVQQVSQICATLCMPMNDLESAVSIDFEVPMKY